MLIDKRMKTQRLLWFLRSILYLAAAVWALMAVFSVGSIWKGIPFQPHSAQTTHMGVDLVSGVQVETFSGLDQVAFRGKQAPSIFLGLVSGSLMVGQEGTPAPLLTLLRAKYLVGSVSMLLQAAVCLLLGRLFALAREGDAYSARSVRMIRMMGGCLLAQSLLGNGFNNFLAHRLAADLGTQTVGYVEGANGLMGVLMLPPRGSLELTGLLFSLFAFALAEVFNQGLRLRQENELTV